jgi:tellurite resistance protein TehA-like permease
VVSRRAIGELSRAAVSLDAQVVATRAAVEGLHPGYFALVMATGIVSVGLNDIGLTVPSVVLMWTATLSYAVLVVLTVVRAARFPAGLTADFTDPRRGFGFFTFVAGTDVLGVRLAGAGHARLALAFLVVGGLAWLVLGYLVPWTAVLGRADRPVLPAANGTWFIWVVASQSVAVLAATLEPTTGGHRRELALLAVFSWSVGVFLYAGVGTLVAARLLLYPVRPADLTPPYWVAMGATAITVLAGARIVQMADAPMVDATRGLVAGASALFWAFGTWLIPALVAAGWWRHVVHRVPLRYEAPLWSIVFPLGMYAVAGLFIGRADNLPIVALIGRQELWVAASVWALTSAAMLAHLVHTLVLAPSRSTPTSAGVAPPAG